MIFTDKIMRNKIQRRKRSVNEHEIFFFSPFDEICVPVYFAALKRTHTHTHEHTHIHSYTHTHTYIYTYTPPHTHTYPHTYTNTLMRKFTGVSTYVFSAYAGFCYCHCHGVSVPLLRRQPLQTKYVRPYVITLVLTQKESSASINGDLIDAKLL